MADEYKVVGIQNKGGVVRLRVELQAAADEGFRWVGTVASSDGGDFVVMVREQKHAPATAVDLDKL